MNAPRRLADRADVVAVLNDDRFVPHGENAPSNGATIQLRREMARFSSPAAHPARRAAVCALIDSLDSDHAARTARDATSAAVGRAASVDEIARTVPTVVMATLLGLDAEPEQLRPDLELVASVIGRDEPATPACDAATERLVAVAARHPGGPVPVLSVLYQNLDATAAAVRAGVHGRRAGTAAEPAVAITRRIATQRAVIAGRPVVAGEEVVLAIGEVGLPYGAGPHECPGQHLAQRIVAGIVDTVCG